MVVQEEQCPRCGIKRTVWLGEWGSPCFNRRLRWGNGSNGPDAGAVRRYDVVSKNFTNFVSPGGPLVIPWYLTFGNTSPGTLTYSN